MNMSLKKSKIENGTKDRREALLFGGAVCLSFVMILIFNMLTPYMSDDLAFLNGLKEQGTSLTDVIRQCYVQYCSENGRAVTHFILRMFLTMPKPVFNVCNSMAFVGLTLILYLNVDTKKRYDLRLFAGLTCLVWIFGVSFAQTVLWAAGACNYLWGSLIILGYVSVYRLALQKEIARSESYQAKPVSIVQMILPAILLYGFGVLAGWCNENTSGGGFLLAVYFLMEYAGMITDTGLCLQKKKRRSDRPIRLYMITGLLGQITGMILMVIAPGNRLRTDTMSDENFTGIMKYVARFQKITLVVKEEFLILILAAILLYLICRAQGKTRWQLRRPILFFGLFWIVDYVLVMAPPTQSRAFFGAGLLLIIAIGELFGQVCEDTAVIKAVKEWLVIGMLVFLAFSYIENGTDLIRIYRESMERWNYLEEAGNAGTEGTILVPQLRPDFETPYSEAYGCDLQEDEKYWINHMYAAYFGVDWISAIPRDEWEEKRPE